jgi:hypothetical protein
VDEARPVHRLDRSANRFAVTSEPPRQPVEPIRIGRRRATLDHPTLGVEQVEVETLATQIQSGVQHRSGPPLR